MRTKTRYFIASALLAVPMTAGAVVLTGATKFVSTLNITGALSKTGSYFAIDHPLDPVHKILYHSSVESPDAKNVYNGIAILDETGAATIKLPAYFDALNKDVRYQVKPIGQPMPGLFIKTEEKNNRFAIGGGKPRGEVSWQITGVRHDAYIVANPIVPEVEKSASTTVNKGQYLFPEGYKNLNPFGNFLITLWHNILGH